jgi:hypothetical protein
MPVYYKKKLNGYRCSHRNRWILLNNYLSAKSFILFEFYLDIFDFDHKHLGFGTFTVNFSKLAKIFNCSTSSVRSWHKEILKSGLINKTDEKNIFVVANPTRYLPAGIWKGEANYFVKKEKNQPTEIIFQLMKEKSKNIEKKEQINEKNSPNILKENTSKALGLSKYSYKVNYSRNSLTNSDKDWLKDNY